MSAAVGLRIRSVESDYENPPRGMPLKSLLEIYCRGRPALGNKTLGQYRNAVRLARHWMLFVRHDHTDCDLLFRLDVICDFARWLIDGRQPATANGRLDVLKMLWQFAHDEGLCDQPVPPKRKWPRFKEPKRDPVAWTLSEIERLIAGCVLAPAMRRCKWWTPDHWVALICAFLATSERFEAMLGCPRSALQGNVLIVPAHLTKDKKEAPVVLESAIAEKLRALPIVSDSPLFFPYPHELKTLRERYDADVLANSKLPRTGKHKFHCLRRTSITQIYIVRGIEAAMRSGRHFSPSLTLAKYVSQSVVQQQTGTPNFEVPWPPNRDPQKKLF
jgi:integrase